MVQLLPLRALAWFGRGCGQLLYWFDARHRRVAEDNLTAAFGNERSPAEIRALARENFRRFGENSFCAIKTAVMKPEQLRACVQVKGLEKLMPRADGQPPPSHVFAIGHFGNFELYAHGEVVLPRSRLVTTYRALNQPVFDRLLLGFRQRSGCLFFERRVEGAALRAAMKKHSLSIGLLSDQHAGNKGLWLPFFGRLCSTTAAPAVYALRYKMPLHAAICYRTSPGRWLFEVGDEIPVHENGRRRSSEEIMLDVNRAFEQAVRRDPANWFWLHRRWKTQPGQPAARPPATREMIRT